MLKYTTEQFIEKVKKRKKGFIVEYDFSKFVYSGTFEKGIIICPFHGEFTINANNLLNGQDCYYCGKLKNIKPISTREKVFLEKVGKTKYSFEKFKFFNSHTISTVICPDHGEFQMAARHLLRGHGCKLCGYLLSNFRKEDWVKRGKGRVGIFYVILCKNANERFIKIGITYQSIYERYRKKGYMPYEYTILQEIKSEDLGFIWDLESKIKRTQSHKKYAPLIPFDGSVNECFLESLNYEEK